MGLWTETGTGSNWKERVEVDMDSPREHQPVFVMGVYCCQNCGMSWRPLNVGFEEILNKGGVKMHDELPVCTKARRGAWTKFKKAVKKHGRGLG